MSTKHFFIGYVITKAKNTATGLAIHSKERMYMVDSGASLHMTGATVKQNLEYTDRQRHCGLRHASEGLNQGAWRLFMGTCGVRFNVSAIVWKTMQ